MPALGVNRAGCYHAPMRRITPLRLPWMVMGLAVVLWLMTTLFSSTVSLEFGSGGYEGDVHVVAGAAIITVRSPDFATGVSSWRASWLPRMPAPFTRLPQVDGGQTTDPAGETVVPLFRVTRWPSTATFVAFQTWPILVPPLVWLLVCYTRRYRLARTASTE